jgi:hypothetical protein
VKALEKLQSSNAVLAVLVLALLAQMPHAQHVFYHLGSDLGWFGWVQSWFGAVALEFAVLVFVVRGKQAESWGFAVFSVAINLVYYYDPELTWYLPKATWLLSAGLPVAIALYSHEVAGKHAVNHVADKVDIELPVAGEVDIELQPVAGEVDTPVAIDNWPVAEVDTPVTTVDIAGRAAQLLSQHDGDRARTVLTLSSEGFKQVDIASTLGVHKTQVSRWLKKG